jgi:FkbM family methyltransferase
MTRLAVNENTKSSKWFTGVNLADKSLAATLELIYLRPVLARMPDSRRTALDVGAHKGEVTANLLDLSYRVLAVEPQEFLADRLQTRFAKEITRGQMHLQRCAASDHIGTSHLIVGSASTVSSLESEWTTIAFPEEFRTPRKVPVKLITAGELLARLGWVTLGFAKVDVEGHELPALRGLYNHPSASSPTASPPCVVMFEANHCFPDRAQECLGLLWARGYRMFDIFIRWGIDPIAGERFNTSDLPRVWHSCGKSNFYANIIAYHEESPVFPSAIDPTQFVVEYEQLKGEAE